MTLIFNFLAVRSHPLYELWSDTLLETSIKCEALNEIPPPGLHVSDLSCLAEEEKKEGKKKSLISRLQDLL